MLYTRSEKGLFPALGTEGKQETQSYINHYMTKY